jgi:GDPmannose 4,6-dehydratase
MLQQKKPGDYVIATGEQHSVRDFVDCAARELGITLRWRGKGVAEHAVVASSAGVSSRLKRGQIIVRVDPRYFRPTEVQTLLGDASKARRELGWKPVVKFGELVAEMVREDLRIAQRDALMKRHGYETPEPHE